MIGLVPIRNFGVVKPNIYRSAQPIHKYEYQWLKNNLKLQEIFNLRAELDHDSKLAPVCGIHSVTIPIKDHFPPTIEEANWFMDVVKVNSDLKRPMLFHCEHGHGRTSIFSVLSKVALGSTIDEAIEDEKHRFGYEFKHQQQLDWLKNFYLTNC